VNSIGKHVEDYNVDDVLYVFDNLQKRDTDMRISTVQFLRDRELGICDEKHGIVIKESVSDCLYSRDRKCIHDYETNVRRTMSMKRDIGGIEM